MSDSRIQNSRDGEPGLESSRTDNWSETDTSSRTTREPAGTTTIGQATTAKPAVYTQPATPRTQTGPRTSGERISREPTLGELFTGLSNDLTTLMRKELELARTEIEENAKKAMRAGIMIGIGGFLAYAGLIVVLIAASIALGDALDNLWLGTAIVGLVVIIIAAILLAVGKSKLDDVNLTPRKAVNSIERDVEMAKEKLS